jgi:glycosyltransferase involved in cell wall biosynthesis
MNTPAISVVIPTFNRARVLERAIESVLIQDFRDFELIVVDDGSTDSTREILEKVANCEGERVRCVFQENRGVSSARNLGIRASSGQWVAFLDSDDEWLIHKLSLQVAFAEKNPEVSIIHGEEIWIRRGIRVNPMKKHQKFGGFIFEKCLPLCVISPSAVMIKKDLLIHNGGFREDYPVCEDYDLWLELTALHEVGFIESPLIKKYGGHDDQLSASLKAMDYYRLKTLCRLWTEKHYPVNSETALLNEIRNKARILLKGLEKYGRETEKTEVCGWLSNIPV